MLARNIKTKLFLPKQIIITRGDIGHQMFFVHKGEVEVSAIKCLAEYTLSPELRYVFGLVYYRLSVLLATVGVTTRLGQYHDTLYLQCILNNFSVRSYLKPMKTLPLLHSRPANCSEK